MDGRHPEHHRPVPPVQAPEPGHEVRIGQETHVEHEIGVDGDAVLEAEGQEGDPHAGPDLAGSVHADQHVAELVHGQRGSVDHAIGDLPEVGQRFALGPDGVVHLPVPGQGVAAARLVVATQKRLVTRLDEQDLDLMPSRSELPQGVQQVGQVLPLPHVDAQGHPVGGLDGAGHQVGEGRQQRGGQVVHAEVAHVLEALDRKALAGPAHPRDHDEGDRLGHD